MGILIISSVLLILHLNRYITCILSEVYEATLSTLMSLLTETSDLIEEKILAGQSYLKLIKGIYLLVTHLLALVTFLSLFDFVLVQIFLAVLFLPFLHKVVLRSCFLTAICLPRANRGACFGVAALLPAIYLLWPVLTGPLFYFGTFVFSGGKVISYRPRSIDISA